VPALLVRGVDEELIRALKERAGAHGRSAEAENIGPFSPPRWRVPSGEASPRFWR
jgi:hypothetical protein